MAASFHSVVLPNGLVQPPSSFYFFDKQLIRFDPLQDFEVPFSKHGSKTASLSECWTKPMRLGWMDDGGDGI